MKRTTTITSKRQITIPAAIYRQVGLSKHQKLVVTHRDSQIILSPLSNLLDELAGSLKMPKKWQGKSLDQIIESSKKEYFRKR